VKNESTISVLIVSSAYSETSLRRQVAELAKLIDVRVIAPRTAHVLVFPRYRPVESVPEGRFRTVSNIPLFGTQYLFLTLDLGLRRNPPDVIHIDYDPWTVVFWQIRLLLWLFSPRTQIIAGSKKNTFRQYPGLLGRAKRRLAKRGTWSVTHVLCASRKNRDMLTRELGLPRTATTVVTSVGVDVAQFCPRRAARAQSGPLVVGFCGRMAPHKGVLDLVAVVGELVATGWDVELRLLGAGPLDRLLHQLAAERDWLTLFPAVPVNEVPDFLQSLDIYVLPARNLPDHEEHDAHALIQAMACTVPVVATRSGIVPEILNRAHAGLLVDANDRAAISAALTVLLENRDLRQRCGEAGRALASAFYSIRETARRQAETYRRVGEDESTLANGDSTTRSTLTSRKRVPIAEPTPGQTLARSRIQPGTLMERARCEEGPNRLGSRRGSGCRCRRP